MPEFCGLRGSVRVTSVNLFDSAKAKATRQSFGEVLVKLGEEDSRVVVLDADLSKSTKTELFAAKFPDRFFNFGIAEANMIGAAAGLAGSGFVPFAASFGCFLTGRFDQIRMSVSFSNANVRLVGTHAGVAIGEDGHSQMALEDVCLMRVLPNMIVFQPADHWDTESFMRWSLTHEGPCYMRLTRQNLPQLIRPKESAFEFGKWLRVLVSKKVEKSKIVILGTGGTVGPCVEAGHELQERHGLSGVEVWNANWIQPLDEASLKDIVGGEPRLIVSVEDHYRWGGLGSSVSERLSDWGSGVRLLRIGVDRFGESGSPDENLNNYGLSKSRIVECVLANLET